MFVVSLITYIRQGRILLPSLLTYTHSRDFVMFVASLVTYICQGGILLLSHFMAYTHLRDLGFVSNLHPSRRNLVT